MMGNVLTAGQGQNPARKAMLEAGLPQEIPAWTLNIVCGSGMKSVHEAANAIKAGDADVHRSGRHGEHEHGALPRPQCPQRLPHGRRSASVTR